jgi:hypothetical protein
MSNAGKTYYEKHKDRVFKKIYARRKTLVGYLRRLFQVIKYRCNSPNDSKYRWYGGKGVELRFKNSQEFVDYVVNELRVDPRGLTIDRIDNNGHYEKGNIQFITAAENLYKRNHKCQTC